MINYVYRLFLFEKKMVVFLDYFDAKVHAIDVYGQQALDRKEVEIVKLSNDTAKYFGVEPGYAINVEFE